MAISEIGYFIGGARNHMVIMPAADLDKAVDALTGAAHGSAGERRMAISVAMLFVDGRDHRVTGGNAGFWPGDTHAYGEEGVRFYTRRKSITQRWPESTAKGAEFAMPVAG